MNHSKIVIILVLSLCALPSCAGSAISARPRCPADEIAPIPLPGVRPPQRTTNYWLAHLPDVDKAWLDQEEIRSFNRTLTDPERTLPIDDLNTLDTSLLEKLLQRRLRFLVKMVSQGHYRHIGASRPSFAFLPANWMGYLAPGLHVATAPIPMYCGPSQAHLVAANDPLLLNRNRCSTVQAGEDIQVLGIWPNGMRLARTYYAFGWIAKNAPLSETKIAPSEAFASGPTLPLTRRRWMHQAFEFLDHPYGWGGDGYGLDCSSFVMQVFKPFGIKLPRHSRQQMRAIPHTIAVPPGTSDDKRLALIDSAQRQGVVLLHFAGHIMLYIGRDNRGTPMAIHAFAQYLKPCNGIGRKETRMLVKRVDISPLSLGGHTSTGSLLSRIDTIGILGPSADPPH